jgi:hypothetical protein
VTEDGVGFVTVSSPGAEHEFVTKILGDVPAAPMNLITEQVVDPTSPVVEARTDRLSHDTIAELGAERTSGDASKATIATIKVAQESPKLSLLFMVPPFLIKNRIPASHLIIGKISTSSERWGIRDHLKMNWFR